MKYSLWATTADLSKSQFNNKWSVEIHLGDKQQQVQIKDAYKLEVRFTKFPSTWFDLAIIQNNLEGKKALFSVCACLKSVYNSGASGCRTTRAYLKYIKSLAVLSGEVNVSSDGDIKTITPVQKNIPCWSFLFKATEEDIEDPETLKLAKANYLISDYFFDNIPGVEESNWVYLLCDYKLWYYDKFSDRYPVKIETYGLF